MRLTAVAAVCTAALAVASAASAAPVPSPGRAFGLSHRPVCGPAAVGTARCHAEVVTDELGAAQVAAAPAGYGATELQSAYGLTSLAASAGGDQTIAIVDAYDDPAAELDLTAYRAAYGLPGCASADRCFRKVDQTGGTSYPAADAGWAEEISLDLDVASAVCPHCRLLLVEARSNSLADLGAAVDEAAKLGATVISNSYGGNEWSGETSVEPHYNHPGIAITASSGDSGYGVSFPAASRYVTAVGGTTLTADPSSARGWSETAWSGGGSGCSAYVPKPAWQVDAGCSRRVVADVAADADPATGVAVYDSAQGGWLVVGGTSAAAPLVAGADALLGSQTAAASYWYGNALATNDVTAGSNGTCTPDYLCTASLGYDGPTGLGSPLGSASQSPPPAAATGSATSVTASGATLSGTANPNGLATRYHFDYGTTASYGSRAPTADADAGSASTPQTVSAAVAGLQPGTTYHYRLSATSAGGTADGADRTFTTAPAAAPPAAAPSPAPAPSPPAATPAPRPVSATPAAPAPVQPRPGLALSVRSQRLARAIRSGLRAAVRSCAGCVVRLTLRLDSRPARVGLGGAAVAKKTASRLPAAGTARVRIRFRRALRQALRHARRVHLTLAVSSTSPAGTRASLTRRITLRR